MQKEFKAKLVFKTEKTEKKILKHKVELNVGKYSMLLIYWLSLRFCSRSTLIRLIFSCLISFFLF